MSNNIIRFDDGAKLKDSETFGITGSMVDVSLLKSRSNVVGQPVTLVFDLNKGFDADLSLFILLKEAGRINGAGVGLYLGDRSDMKFSQKTFKTKLESLPELKQLFMTEVITELKAMLTNSEDARSDLSTLSSSIMDSINSEMVA